MATARAGRHDGTTWVPSSSSCRSGCRLSAPRRCARSRRPTCAASRRRPTTTATTPRRCTTRSWAPSSSRPRATAPRWRCGPSTRPAPSTATSPAARSSRPTPRTCPSSSTRSAPSCRPAAWASSACCTRSSAPSARPTAASSASCIPAGRRRPSRSCTSSSTGAWRPRSSPTSRTPCARCWPTCAASCATSRSCASASTSVVDVAREGAARYEEDEVAEVVAFLEWLARDNFIFLGARDYELVDGALRVVPGLRPRAARRRGALGLRQAGGGRDARPQPARARARRRAAAGLQDQPAVAGAPPRAHGLRRHPPGVDRRRDRRRGAHHRPLHDQGLRRARLRDAACCTASCSGSWPART